MEISVVNRNNVAGSTGVPWEHAAQALTDDWRLSGSRAELLAPFGLGERLGGDFDVRALYDRGISVGRRLVGCGDV